MRVSSSSGGRAKLQCRVLWREATLDLGGAGAHGDHGAAPKAAAADELARTAPVANVLRGRRGRVGRGRMRRSCRRRGGRQAWLTRVEAEIR